MMTDDDRAERAFRTALDTHAAEAPTETPQLALPRRRPWWVVSLAAAVTVTAAVLVVPLVTDDGDGSTPGPAESPTAPADGREWQWVSFRNVEVQAPAAWDFGYEAIRPDCIDLDNPNDPWARDVPRAPYITVGVPNRGVPALGCLRQPAPGDPSPAFGQVPFPLWQPYVKLDEARPDLDYADRKDGEWVYRDWHLTRTTIDRVQITVLAPPDRPALGVAVVGSARRVDVNTNGCEVDSPVAAEKFAAPRGPAIPAAADVEAIAICEYSRWPGHAGLEGSRRITGEPARALVTAIHQAPVGGGPDEPEHCLATMYGERAIALRFFAGTEDTASPLAEAYVYYDWCFGNGIVDAQGRRQLTEANCSPLFARPPVSLWGGHRPVIDACGPFGP